MLDRRLKFALFRQHVGFDFIFTSGRQYLGYDQKLDRGGAASSCRTAAVWRPPALAHLVEMYDNGRWRHYYKKEEAFAEAVREARQAVEQWTDIVNKVGGGTDAAR